MHPRLALALAIPLLATSFAGCIGTGDEIDPTATPTATPALSYVPLDAEALSKPIYDIGPRITERVKATVDGIPIFVEYWLPEGDGPWPTVLHSTPYAHQDRAIDVAFQVLDIEGDRDFFVSRGYAFMIADVRGFGESGGCVEVWGANEQQDQYDLVQWIAEQSWSDGNVGMMGASYPGTTPMEAATLNPPALKAIVAVAGLTDPYYDWHFGGMPNGESGPVGSPAAYHAFGAIVPFEATHGVDWATSAGDTGCNAAQFVLDAYSPDGVYTDFYTERNLTLRVKDVTAAVLYTQGFRDNNVKPSQVLRWFNELESPKKAILGPWAHQYPVRDDWKDMMLAWFDQHLKGIETGVMAGPVVEVHNNADTWRADVAFPTSWATPTTFFMDGETGLVAAPPAEGSAELKTGSVDTTLAFTKYMTGEGPDAIVLRTEPLAADMLVSGVVRFLMDASLTGAPNAMVTADLYAVKGDAMDRITYGALNFALRNDVKVYEPMPDGERVAANIWFQPVEYVVEAGHALELVIRPTDLFTATTPEGTESGTLTLFTGGEAGTRLVLPVLDGRPDVKRPDGV